ncbi:MAG: TerB family tellurite resistance protein [Congregibacter sp.]
MMALFKKLFADSEEDTTPTAEKLNLAAAALLVEVARADFTQDAEEEQAMLTALTVTLGVDASQVETLVSDAEARVDEATSLFEFTRLINDHYAYEDKYRLIEAMWRVAFADGAIDKYEEHMVRRASDLIYLNHEDFIRAKHAAAQAVNT